MLGSAPRLVLGEQIGGRAPARAAESGGGMSRLLRLIVKPRNLVRRIDWPADQLDGRSYLLLRGLCQANTASCNVAQSVEMPAPSFNVAGRPPST